LADCRKLGVSPRCLRASEGRSVATSRASQRGDSAAALVLPRIISLWLVLRASRAWPPACVLRRRGQRALSRARLCEPRPIDRHAFAQPQLDVPASSARDATLHCDLRAGAPSRRRRSVSVKSASAGARQLHTSCFSFAGSDVAGRRNDHAVATRHVLPRDGAARSPASRSWSRMCAAHGSTPIAGHSFTRACKNYTRLDALSEIRPCSGNPHRDVRFQSFVLFHPRLLS